MADNFTRLNAQGTIARPADQATFDAGLRKHMLRSTTTWPRAWR